MFFCSSGGSEPLSGSKTDIMRGIITEKLTTAAQEIFAVVERIVTDYEAEASGFRQQMNRQRRQLELLQPRVKLLREELVPDQRSHEVVAVGEEEEQPDEEEAESQDLLPVTTKEEVEKEKPPPGNLGPFQDDLKDPESIIPSGVPSVGTRPDGPGTSSLQNHIVLRIRLLEDSETTFLSDAVFKTSLVQDVKCPCGLEESDFLDHLRSSVPQLANGEPFDLLKTNRSRKLHPLSVKAVTPEEIYSTVGSTGYSTLYIRLKAGKDKTTQNKEEFSGSQRTIDPPPSDPVTTDGTALRSRVSVKKKIYRRRNIKKLKHLDFRILLLEDSNMEKLSKAVYQKTPVQDLKCPRGLQESDFLDLLRSSFPQLADGEPFDLFTTDHSRRLLPLRVKSLTPEEIYSTITSSLYIRLKPGGKKQIHNEKEGDGSADPETTDETDLHSRSHSSARKRPRRCYSINKQKHLELRILLLEDPSTKVLSTPVFKNSPVQDLKCRRGLQESDFLDLLRSSFPQLANGEPFDLFKTDRSRKLLPLRVNTLTPEEISSTITATGSSALYIRLKEGQETRALDGFPRVIDPPPADPLFLKNNKTGLHASTVLNAEYRGDSRSSRSASKPTDLQTEEAENNVDPSNDGQVLDKDDWNLDSEQQTQKRSKRKRAKRDVKKGGRAKMNCKVCGVWYKQLAGLIKHSWSHMEQKQDVCGVCEEKFDSVEKLKEHLQNYKKLHSCSLCGKNFVSMSNLSKHTARHMAKRVFKCSICDQTFTNVSSLYHHRLSHQEEKPHQCDICQKSFILKKQLLVHRETHSRDDEYSCNICNKSFSNRRAVTQHRLIHSAERRYACEVCGKRFKLHSTLKAHMRTHTVQDRPFLCHICSKAFPSNEGLSVHLTSHSREKLFVCDVCGKSFSFRSSLLIHTKTHSSEAPHKCSKCGRCFKWKSHLKDHLFRHSGIKRFSCGVCGKACAQRDHLKVHMRTHNGEKPYKCSICEKAFTQGHCLKTHMKIHQTNENPVPGPSESSVTSSADSPQPTPPSGAEFPPG